MTRWKCAIAVLYVLSFSSVFGCSEQWVRDLDAIPPFSLYAGQRVKLTRPVHLTEFAYDPNAPFWVISYQPFQPLELHFIRSMTLETGAEVDVLRTYLFYNDHGPLFGGAPSTKLRTAVRVRPKQADWPTQLEAYFIPSCRGDFQYGEQYGVNTENSRRYLSGVEFVTGNRQPTGCIRPSPWEPLETPAKRDLPWPATAPIVSKGLEGGHREGV